MSHLVLPQEIIDCFIDEFRHSVEDLRNMCLVDRLWLRRARYHLIRSLTLTPQDLESIRASYVNVNCKATREYVIEPDSHPSSDGEQSTCTSRAGSAQPIQSFISSIVNSCPSIRGLRLLSFIQAGVRGVSVNRHRLGGVDSSLTRRARQEVASNERLRDLETKARWDAVDLPWGRRGGIHALPFKNLRFLHIQWSVFSWTSPDHDILDGIDPDHWPGYQLAMLIKNNTYTLDHVFIDEYPGFCLEQDHASSQGDALLEVLARNAPSLRTLSLGGLLQPYHIHRRHAASETALLSRNRASYPCGEKVPHVMPSMIDDSTHRKATLPSLQRLFLQGFDSESTILIEGTLTSCDLLSLGGIRYLALSAMPRDYDYLFMFSKMHQSLTHLTLDLDESIRNLILNLCSFPQLESLQLMIYDSYRTWDVLHHFVDSLSKNAFHINGSMPPQHIAKVLHFAFGPGVSPKGAKFYLIGASVDDALKELVSVPAEPMGRSKVQLVTMDLSETVLAEVLPLTFWTGCLKTGKTDDWWCWPSYLH
ncbi:hypothetical protein EV361DRAFT_889116 [Lentinula raphanica]|uniref:Uncharacterized protein n=1 Tax=Lentinula raphanica TaxID=153919 RepID=A0AA38P9F0_9AGAR|nr:hypothetical protein F5878DRAFT_725069 [Lentinula raphanica]KAJ3975370.1 hypothetical protein EV361DRAFT_889116 [Lentinula raphanica]